MVMNEYQLHVLGVLDAGLVAVVTTGVLLLLLSGIRTARAIF